MKIIEELNFREQTDEKNYSIIGTEIKTQRLKNNLTQKETSDMVCSSSYLCKIERNDIVPNPEFIEKLCDKVSIKEEELKVLYNLSKYIDELIEGFYYDDLEVIKKDYELIKNFDNYKALIMKLIYYTYFNMLDDGVIVNNKLDKLISSMNDKDLVIYAIFSALLYSKIHNFKEAKQILERIVRQKDVTDVLRAISMTELLRIYYLTNSRRFLPLSYRLSTLNNQLMNHKKYDEVIFLEAKYYLMNNIYDEFYYMMPKFKNTIYEDSIKLLNDIFNHKVKNIKEYKNISHFYYLIALYYIDNKRFKESIITLDMLNAEEIAYIKYLEHTLSCSDDLFIECDINLFPTSFKLHLWYLIELSKDVIVKKLMKMNRYKIALETVFKIEAFKKEFDSSW